MARILVVDDSMFQRLMVSDVLQRAGHETVEAETGSAAIARLQDGGFDMVSCDLLMPDGSGEDVLQWQREHGDRTPIVIVSANVQESIRARVEALGAHAFLNKPVDETALLEVTGRILRVARAV